MAGQTLPLADAAALLGLTPEALRKRCQRGTARGQKIDGEWYATLDALAGQVDSHREEHAEPAEPMAGRQDGRQDNEVALLHAQLGFARERIAFLEAALEREQQLVLAALTRPALPATTAASTTTSSRPWWHWRRWWPGAR